MPSDRPGPRRTTWARYRVTLGLAAGGLAAWAMVITADTANWPANVLHDMLAVAQSSTTATLSSIVIIRLIDIAHELKRLNVLLLSRPADPPAGQAPALRAVPSVPRDPRGLS